MIEADEVIYYRSLEETLLNDLRFKLVFNFTNFNKVHDYYEKLSDFDVLNLNDLKGLAKQHLPKHYTLSDIFKRALWKPGSLF